MYAGPNSYVGGTAFGTGGGYQTGGFGGNYRGDMGGAGFGGAGVVGGPAGGSFVGGPAGGSFGGGGNFAGGIGGPVGGGFGTPYGPGYAGGSGGVDCCSATCGPGCGLACGEATGGMCGAGSGCGMGPGGMGCGIGPGCGSVVDGTMVSYVGGGQGDYVQETVYKYVGGGAGNYGVVPIIRPGPNLCLIFVPICILLSCLLLIPLLMAVLSPETTIMTTTPAALTPAALTPAALTPAALIAPPPPEEEEPVGPRADCIVFGDPHVISFDGVRSDYYTPGEYWIVKSDTVSVQGKYAPTPMTNGLAVTKAIAISGPFIQNHKLIINSLDAGSTIASYDGQPILQGFPSHFASPDDMVTAHYDGMGSTMQKSRINKPLHVVHIHLPKGVRIQVNQWNEPGEGAYMNVKITMSHQPGQDGHCGNFNGNQADDARVQVRARLGRQGVPEGDLLFPGPKTPINPSGTRPDVSDCEQSKLDQAKELCKKSEKKWNPSMACLIDVCFGGAGFANAHVQ